MTWLYTPPACSTATEDSSSEPVSPASTGELWCVLSGTPTQRPLSWRGWKKRTWIRRLSGMTSPRSTVVRGVAGWISLLPVSTANRSRVRAGHSVSMMSDGCGRTLPGSWLTWNPDTCSWRTSPDLFDSEGSIVCAGILPLSGSMRNGVVTPRPPLEPRTAVTGSGSWHTPTTSHAGGGNAENNRGEPTLVGQARMWGTPTARDDQKTPEAYKAMKRRLNGTETVTSLTVQAKMWPTPRASMNENRTTQHAPSHGTTHGRTLAGEASGHPTPTTTPAGNTGSPKADLNPRFVASLMGLPPDWLNPSTSVETGSYREWLRKHSPPWRLELDADR